MFVMLPSQQIHLWELDSETPFSVAVVVKATCCFFDKVKVTLTLTCFSCHCASCELGVKAMVTCEPGVKVMVTLILTLFYFWIFSPLCL